MTIDYQVSFEYYCVMLHKPIYNFASPISLPCWLGGRLVVAYALAVAIMILAVSIASPSESDAFANAALAGCWQMLLALLVGAAVFGFSCAVVEATTMRVLFAAPVPVSLGCVCERHGIPYRRLNMRIYDKLPHPFPSHRCGARHAETSDIPTPPSLFHP